jgi:SAM-dependent methyltransferase
MSEMSKHRDAILKYCVGNGADVGSGGDPVKPEAIQIELSLESYLWYNSNNQPRSPIQWHGDDAYVNLPFKNETLDYLVSSHLIEDYLDWQPLLKEWTRVLKVGGNLILMAPEKQRWAEAIRRGQPCNCAHKREPDLYEMSREVMKLGNMDVIEEKLTESYPGDYNILLAAKKRNA